MIRLRRFGDVTQLVMARAVLGRPLYVACAYYLDGLLLDDGPPVTAAELSGLLSTLEVRQAVLTHAHEDHAGATPLLQARGITPLAHPLAMDVLAHPPHQRPYQRITWGRQPPSSAVPIGDAVVTRRYRFRVVPTPGHSRDHISLFEEQRGWLFAGDLFLSPYVKVLRSDESPHQTITSLRTVLGLPVTMRFCASGKVIDDARAALQRKLDFMERLRDDAWERRAKGMSTERIRRELLGEETWWPLLTGGHFSKQNLIDALLRDEPRAA